MNWAEFQFKLGIKWDKNKAPKNIFGALFLFKKVRIYTAFVSDSNVIFNPVFSSFITAENVDPS